MCRSCRKARDAMRAKRLLRKLDGLCIYCPTAHPSKAEEGHVGCRPCLQIKRAKRKPNKRRPRKRKAQSDARAVNLVSGPVQPIKDLA